MSAPSRPIDGSAPRPLGRLRRPSLPARRLPSRLALAGVLLVVVFAAGLALLVAGRLHGLRLDSRSVTGLAAFAVALTALALRGRLALPALVAIAAMDLANPHSSLVTLPLLLASFNVALRGERGEILLGAAICIAALLGSYALYNPVDTGYQPYLQRAVAAGLASAAGLYLAARSAYIASLRDRASQLEREQRLLTEQAVAAERVRIARELHDVVAHGVSLMVVQAQALGALDGSERDAAGARIASIGREALTEMHRMLGVLRPEADEAPALAPAPGIGDVRSLVERARGAGLEVSLEVDGQPRALPAGVDLSAYRIVQEALTNVVKHAGARHAGVRLRYAADALELSVTDDGAGAQGGGRAGHGLVGMRERAALFGGTLEAGSTGEAGGYTVRAVLPL